MSCLSVSVFSALCLPPSQWPLYVCDRHNNRQYQTDWILLIYWLPLFLTLSLFFVCFFFLFFFLSFTLPVCVCVCVCVCCVQPRKTAHSSANSERMPGRFLWFLFVFVSSPCSFLVLCNDLKHCFLHLSQSAVNYCERR